MDKIKDILYRFWFLYRTRTEKWLIIGGLLSTILGLVAMAFIVRYIERPADIVINCDMDRIFGSSTPVANTLKDTTDVDQVGTPTRAGKAGGKQAEMTTKQKKKTKTSKKAERNTRDPKSE